MEQGQDRLLTHWHDVLAELMPNQRAWLQQSKPVTLHGNTAIIEVASDFTRAQLEGRLRSQIEFALSQRLGHETRVAVTVNPDLEHADLLAPLPSLPTESGPRPLGDLDNSTYPQNDMSTSGLVDTPAPPQRGHDWRDEAPMSNVVDLNRRSQAPVATTGSAMETRLNPRYTFETFVIGASNRFSHAAAVAVSEAPGKAYNPLLIYGDSGLGKTHLLHAIGHYVRSLYPGAKVRYVSSEEFTNEFINAIRDDRKDRFKSKYREIDVLLIDDIQFLQGKDATQDEFFHTFNTLHNAGKQIVLTSDRPPKLLEGLEDRLRSRFEWGLTTDVQAPELETRIAILQTKAALERLTVPRDVIEFIASRIHTNIRELEGALIRVTAYANLNRQEVELSLAEGVLRDLLPEGGEPDITAALIISQTAAYFSVSREQLEGPARSRQIVGARQIAMYLCRELTDMSLPRIGKEFGGRDHTTVMHACRKIQDLLKERRAIYNQVTELTSRIKQQAKVG